MYEFTQDLLGGGNINPADVDVVSMSFAWSESHQCLQPTGAANPTCQEHKITTAEYIQHVNQQFLKLGAMGVTVVTSSGDDGALGNFGKVRQRCRVRLCRHRLTCMIRLSSYALKGQAVTRTLPFYSAPLTGAWPPTVFAGLHPTEHPVIACLVLHQTNSLALPFHHHHHHQPLPPVHWRDALRPPLPLELPVRPHRGRHNAHGVEGFFVRAGALLRPDLQRQQGLRDQHARGRLHLPHEWHHVRGRLRCVRGPPIVPESRRGAYLAKAKGAGLPPASTFNATAHAYPDVSLVGNNYAVYFGVLAGAGFWIPTDGTSASTPVVAGMMALMKSKLGKKLGMVAPLLYALPAGSDVFNDITEGANGCSSTCCGKAGFPATEGWDAATGLGSLDAGKLLAALPGMIRAAGRNAGEYVST